MEINIKLAESLIDAFDSEDTAIVLWDKNDNVLYRNVRMCLDYQSFANS